ncbi:proteoglycan Cow-like isoform X2 [Gordionus sp. m RMFG-2023]
MCMIKQQIATCIPLENIMRHRIGLKSSSMLSSSSISIPELLPLNNNAATILTHLTQISNSSSSKSEPNKDGDFKTQVNDKKDYDNDFLISSPLIKHTYYPADYFDYACTPCPLSTLKYIHNPVCDSYGKTYRNPCIFRYKTCVWLQRKNLDHLQKYSKFDRKLIELPEIKCMGSCPCDLPANNKVITSTLPSSSNNSDKPYLPHSYSDFLRRIIKGQRIYSNPNATSPMIQIAPILIKDESTIDKMSRFKARLELERDRINVLLQVVPSTLTSAAAKIIKPEENENLSGEEFKEKQDHFYQKSVRKDLGRIAYDQNENGQNDAINDNTITKEDKRCDEVKRNEFKSRLLEWFEVLAQVEFNDTSNHHRAYQTYQTTECLPNNPSFSLPFKNHVWWMFKNLDKNMDLQLDTSELDHVKAPYLENREPCLTNYFTRCDTDGDMFLTTKEWCNCFGNDLSKPCNLAKSKTLPSNNSYAYIPSCDSIGYFKPVQCHDIFCWCVDPLGLFVTGSKNKIANTNTFKCPTTVTSNPLFPYHSPIHIQQGEMTIPNKLNLVN